MLEKIFGTTAQADLLDKALTHPSFTKEQNLDSLLSYERLEFFGDSVLKLFTPYFLIALYNVFEYSSESSIKAFLK